MSSDSISIPNMPRCSAWMRRLRFKRSTRKDPVLRPRRSLSHAPFTCAFHMRRCNQCVEWVTSLVDLATEDLARGSWFKITFHIPQKPKNADQFQTESLPSGRFGIAITKLSGQSEKKFVGLVGRQPTEGRRLTGRPRPPPERRHNVVATSQGGRDWPDCAGAGLDDAHFLQ